MPSIHHLSLIVFDQERHTRQTLSPQQFSNHWFSNFLLLQGMKKSDFSGHQLWGPKILAKTGLATDGQPSSRTYVDINVCRVWRTCSRRCKTMETKRCGKLLSRTWRNNRNLCYFSPVDKNFADETAPVLGSRNGPQNGGHPPSLNLIRLCPGGLAPV